MNTTASLPIEQKSGLQIEASKLNNEIMEFKKQIQYKYQIDYWLNVVAIVLGLVLSASVAISGILDQGLVSAILGAIVGVTIGFQTAFNPGERAEFYKRVVAESENLCTDCTHIVESKKEFKDLISKFETLRRYAAESLPRGRGMETISEMYKELQSTK